MPVKIARNRLDATIQAFQLLASFELVIGVPDANSKREGETVTNALIAKIAEDGSPANNIPARPVITPGIMKAKPEIAKEYRSAALALLSGRAGDVAGHLAAAGEAGVKSVRKEILTGSHAPLKPATLARRRAKGSTSFIPLYDSGQFYASIGYELRKKTKDKR